MRKPRLILLLGLLGGQTACATLAPGSGATAGTALAPALDSIFSDTAFAHAHWGIVVRSAGTGETLYERNPDRVFVPASNMKLLTGFGALEALGPEYRYRTEVGATGPVRDGVLQGNLVVRGHGDPTFSSRFEDEPRQVFRAWADSLRAHGVTRVAGAIVGVDSAFADPPLGAGWSWDDLHSYYAAEFGALQVNEGAVDVRLFPSRNVGDPAVVVLDPPTGYVPVSNRVVTGAPGADTRVRIERDPSGPGITVAGEIAFDTVVERTVAVRNPTMFFLTLLRETLRESGVTVEGVVVDADELPTEDLSVRRAVPLFYHSSAPLSEILPGMMKPSQNWIAETLLRTVGLELRGEGTARAGAAVVDSILRVRGLEADELRMADGSGLSRYNLVSPDLLADLLADMQQSPNWEVWHASLPVGGAEGTLRRRMTEGALTGNVHAKTGTLSGVRALSGYLTTTRGERIIFSTLINNHMRSAAGVDRVVEAALERIATDGAAR